MADPRKEFLTKSFGVSDAVADTLMHGGWPDVDSPDDKKSKATTATKKKKYAHFVQQVQATELEESREEALKAWHADSHPLTKNEDGTPKVFYHGTGAGVDFDKFKRRPGDVGIHFGTAGQANDRIDYLASRTDSKKLQDKVSIPRVIPVHLNIRNPLRMRDCGLWNADNMKHHLGELFPHDHHRIFGPKGQWSSGGLETPKDIREFIQSKGYDGIVYKNTGEVEGADHYRRIENETREKLMASQKARGKPLNSFDLEDQQTPEYKANHEANHAYTKFREENGTDSFIVFEPHQIKSVFASKFDPSSKNISESYEQGHCYKNATKAAGDIPGSVVVHGTACKPDGTRIHHAWVEAGGRVVDPTAGYDGPRSQYYETVKAEAHAKYEPHHALINSVRAGHHGPWEEHEQFKKPLTEEMVQLLVENRDEFLAKYGDSDHIHKIIDQVGTIDHEPKIRAAMRNPSFSREHHERLLRWPGDTYMKHLAIYSPHVTADDLSHIIRTSGDASVINNAIQHASVKPEDVKWVAQGEKVKHDALRANAISRVNAYDHWTKDELKQLMDEPGIGPKAHHAASQALAWKHGQDDAHFWSEAVEFDMTNWKEKTKAAKGLEMPDDHVKAMIENPNELDHFRVIAFNHAVWRKILTRKDIEHHAANSTSKGVRRAAGDILKFSKALTEEAFAQYIDESRADFLAKYGSEKHIDGMIASNDFITSVMKNPAFTREHHEKMLNHPAAFMRGYAVYSPHLTSEDLTKIVRDRRNGPHIINNAAQNSKISTQDLKHLALNYEDKRKNMAPAADRVRAHAIRTVDKRNEWSTDELRTLLDKHREGDHSVFTWAAADHALRNHPDEILRQLKEGTLDEAKESIEDGLDDDKNEFKGVVWHGSPTGKIDKFDMTRVKRGVGFHFGSKEHAKLFGKPQEFHVHLKNPYQGDILETDDLVDEPEHVRRAWREDKIKQGYDGAYFHSSDTPEIVAFYPHQITHPKKKLKESVEIPKIQAGIRSQGKPLPLWTSYWFENKQIWVPTAHIIADAKETHEGFGDMGAVQEEFVLFEDGIVQTWSPEKLAEHLELSRSVHEHYKDAGVAHYPYKDPSGNVSMARIGAVAKFNYHSYPYNDALIRNYHGVTREWDRSHHDHIHTIDGIFRNAPKTTNPINTMSGLKQSPQDLIDHVRSLGYHVGDHIHMHLPAFTSTSTMVAMAMAFAKRFNTKITHDAINKKTITHADMHMFHIHVPAGNKLVGLMAHPDLENGGEHELVLPRDTILKVRTAPVQYHLAGRTLHIWHSEVVGTNTTPLK